MLAVSTEKADSPKGLLSNLLGLKAGEKAGQDDQFSLLLKSFSLAEGDTEELNLDSLDKDTLLLLNEKTEDTSKNKLTKLLSLFSLGNEEASDEDQLHPDIIKAIPLKDAKQNIQALIGEAKSYLKEQISQKIDVKELPKTLGGLIRLAEKSGIDVKAINFESLTKSNFSQDLTQALSPVKPQNSLALSRSQIVKPIPIKSETDTSKKPLNVLLTKGNDISTPSIPVVEVLEGQTAKINKPLPSSIQALLHGENSVENTEEDLGVKTDSIKEHDKPQHITQSKTDTLSQKIMEAKQLVQHVAQNMKEAVENYKPPFTRIKMQLNPQKFGDMDVTLIQRGNNVHININANTNALSVMMQNAHELKTQLSAQGLGDAQMNFSSHQQDQQEHKQRQEQAELAYEDFQDFDEEFKEVATALEIVVPRYI